MTTKDEALQMALEALEFSKSYLDDLADVHGTSKKAKPGSPAWHVDRAIAACREALAQQDEQEPVAWMLECPTMTGNTGWILSWSQSGAGLCDRLQGEEHEKPLYAAVPPTRKGRSMSNKQKQAMRLFNVVERIAVRANVDVDEQISWLIDHNGLELLFEAYFSPKTTCPTCASLARAVMLDQAGKA